MVDAICICGVAESRAARDIKSKLERAIYVNLLFSDRVESAGEKVRSSSSDMIAYDVAALSASNLSLRLLGFDAADAAGRIFPPPHLDRNLTVDFKEEASVLKAIDLDIDVDAIVGGADKHKEVIVPISGRASLGSFERLLEVTARRRAWRQENELETRLQDFEADVLGDTGFLLARLETWQGLEVTRSSDEDVQERPAEWSSTQLQVSRSWQWSRREWLYGLLMMIRTTTACPDCTDEVYPISHRRAVVNG